MLQIVAIAVAAWAIWNGLQMWRSGMLVMPRSSRARPEIARVVGGAMIAAGIGFAVVAFIVLPQRNAAMYAQYESNRKMLESAMLQSP